MLIGILERILGVAGGRSGVHCEIWINQARSWGAVVRIQSLRPNEFGLVGTFIDEFHLDFDAAYVTISVKTVRIKYVHIQRGIEITSVGHTVNLGPLVLSALKSVPGIEGVVKNHIGAKTYRRRIKMRDHAAAAMCAAGSLSNRIMWIGIGDIDCRGESGKSPA